MIRGLALVACFAAVALARPHLEEIPAEYQDLVPAQVKEFLTGLTKEDKDILKELAGKHSEFKDEDAALEALKEKSPALYEKAVKLHNLLKEKVEALGDEAKAFAKELVAGVRKLQADFISGKKPSVEDLKEKARNVITKYTALSDAAKADLEKQFPITASIIKNPKFKALADKMLAEKN